MLSLNLVSYVIVIFLIIVIIVCMIGIIVASKFQSKQKQKYNECLRIVKEKENETFQYKTGLSKDEIEKIDSRIDVNNLMIELYNKYIELEDKIRNYNCDFDNLLVGNIKEFYITKLEAMKLKNYREIIDGIDLINYSIVEFDKDRLKFRITMNCFSYKQADNQIISGSNLEKIEKVLILEYKLVNGNWLISDYDNIYEKKLSY